jgi:phosphatidylglycerophosphate synthase
MIIWKRFSRFSDLSQRSGWVIVRRVNPGRNEIADAIPAVILYDETTAALRVAGLTLLDRLVVAVHRAGCNPVIVVCGRNSPPLLRASVLEIPVQFVHQVPAFDIPVLVASSSLLVTADDVRVLIGRRARLTDRSGKPLPIGVTTEPLNSLEKALARVPVIASMKVAEIVVDADSARRAERALWASVKSSTDGLVDRVFNRPCGRPLSKMLIRTPISPNTVSLISVVIGLIAAWFFASRDYSTSIIAALLFQISAIVDCVDGDIARVAFKESPLGKWLDLVGDQVVHLAVFGGIAIGLMKAGGGNTALWLGLSAIAGALLSFAVVVRGLCRTRSDDGGRLQKLIDSATNRDFSVLVLFLAVIGHLEWFLWLTAIGSHLFWMTALVLQLALRPAGERAA